MDLDACHGHTHAILWDGASKEMYHYHATWDFPYTIGCLRGTYSQENVRTISGPRPGGRRGPTRPARGPGPGGPPDLAQAAAKLGISEERLRAALGPPPPDLSSAAQELGIDEATLRSALGVR